MTLLEYYQFCVVLTAVVAGGYQLYFWAQRNKLHMPAKSMELAVDDWIPFMPSMVWIYSLLYYVMIGFTAISIRDISQGVHFISGGLLLLSTGALFYYLYPTSVPASYRAYKIDSLSTRYLAFIQSMDNERNAFPSMHSAIAAYVGLVVSDLPVIGPWLGYGYIFVIAVSCVTTKQHVLVDTIAGVLLGVAVFYVNNWLAFTM